MENEDQEPENGGTDFFQELGKDALRAALLSIVSVLIKALADRLQPNHTRHMNDEDF